MNRFIYSTQSVLYNSIKYFYTEGMHDNGYMGLLNSDNDMNVISLFNQIKHLWRIPVARPSSKHEILWRKGVQLFRVQTWRIRVEEH